MATGSKVIAEITGGPRIRRFQIGRREVLKRGALTGGALVTTGLLARPAILRAESLRPKITHGLQSGDVSFDSGVVWARADRPSRLWLEVATSDSFANPLRLQGPAALETNDFTAKMRLGGLPSGQEVFYRARFQDLGDLKSMSEPATGRFRTAPGDKRDLKFVWSGDTVGQGWGINPDWGGMKIYARMRSLEPDFFIHCGDTVYADGPIEAEKPLPDGGVWKNLTLEEKAKVAETLAEFRASYKYNLMDDNLKAFNADVPMFAQWDDHETVNNWYPQEILDRDDYKVKSVALLAARARRAFLDYMPIWPGGRDRERIYRAIHYGPLLDVFVIDMRSYRGPNTANRQPTASADTVFLGREQMLWLKQQLLASKATWKVVASDMPVGLVVHDGDAAFDNLANRDGPALGREIETADLLSFIKRNGIENVVWLTADVHYTAALHHDPNRAQYQDFTPFWEFVSGPLNAGTYGPTEVDDTFGTQVVFAKTPPPGRKNLAPSEGLQFFGQVEIDGASEVMTVELKDLEGEVLYAVELEPAIA